MELFWGENIESKVLLPGEDVIGKLGGIRRRICGVELLSSHDVNVVVVEVEEGDEEKGGGCRWRRSIYTGLFPRWKVRRGDIVLRAEEEETSTANQSPSDGR